MYGSASAFPTNSFNSTNYCVDVTFAPTPPSGPPTSPTGVSRRCRLGTGLGELDHARRRRWRADHQIHRDAVHRLDRANARQRDGARQLGHGDRVDERDRLHLQGDRHQLGRHQRGLGGVRGGHPRGHDLRTRDAGDRRLRRPELGRAGRQVHRPGKRGRSPASASTRPPPTPARTSAACGAQPEHCSLRPPSRTKAPPAGSS